MPKFKKNKSGFKMKGFSGFKAVEGEDKTVVRLTDERERGKKDPAGEDSRTEQPYTSKQRDIMIERGVAPKDRMEYAATHFA